MKHKFLITPVILAGGFGTRLWPLSRKKLPKQFQNLYKDRTMFQQTISRLDGIKTNKPIVVCNDEHKFIVKDQLAEIKKDCDIILEPFAKNTAPALALAALQGQSEKILLVMPSDHIIGNNKNFLKQIKRALDIIKDNKIVIFGVLPSSANTNYGYIRTSEDKIQLGQKVLEFVEKPNIEKAKKYIKSKNYFWNSGIFLISSSLYLQELQNHSPEVLNICKYTFETMSSELEFKNFDRCVYAKCPAISIDYAIMEHTKKAVLLPLNSDWSDLGTWIALSEKSKKDYNSNVVQGNVITSYSKDSILLNLDNKLLAANAIENMLVVNTRDALLVSTLNNNTDMKSLIEKVSKKEPEKVINCVNENRPWGSFEVITNEKGYLVKKLIVKPGGKLSLQKHKYRSEHWVVISGKGRVFMDGKNFVLNANQSTFIPVNTKHSLENESNEDLVIIEVQTGPLLSEDDIIRYDDIYGRK